MSPQIETGSIGRPRLVARGIPGDRMLWLAAATVLCIAPVCGGQKADTGGIPGVAAAAAGTGAVGPVRQDSAAAADTGAGGAGAMVGTGGGGSNIIAIGGAGGTGAADASAGIVLLPDGGVPPPLCGKVGRAPDEICLHHCISVSPVLGSNVGPYNVPSVCLPYPTCECLERERALSDAGALCHAGETCVDSPAMIFCVCADM
jgi:hypothetical protein